MKILCAPDSFKGSITAVEAAAAMASGLRKALPEAEIDCCPVGDGGDGTLESLLASTKGKLVTTKVRNQMGALIESEIGIFDNGSLAFVESAKAIGVGKVRPEERDVMSASSFGVGQLIQKAVDMSPQRIIVGIGGSSTTDGGCGMAQALGVQFFDPSGQLISEPIGGADLSNIAAIDTSQRVANDIPITVACDVSNPLTGPNGAAHVYGPQKGANADQIIQLDDGLRHLARIISRNLGSHIERIKGAGAAGGLGAGLATFASAKLESGIDIILDLVAFRTRIQGADLCLTGEGSLDEQSLYGKACTGIAREASKAGVPVAALVGSVRLDPGRWLEAGITESMVIGDGLPIEQSKREAAELLSKAAAQIVKKYAPHGNKTGH